MTCIVGLKIEDEVWMGADSFTGGSDGGFPQVNSKLFRHGEMLIGSCGQARAPQIIRYCTEFPEWPRDMDAMEFLVSRWTPAVRASLNEHGHNRQNESTDEMPGALLVAVRGRLFFLGGDFAIDEYERYGAAGSGEAVALGALSITGSVDVRHQLEFAPYNILYRALEAATIHVPTVCPPYNIEKL